MKISKSGKLKYHFLTVYSLSHILVHVQSSPEQHFTSGSPQMVLKMPGGLSSQRHISMDTLPTTSRTNGGDILESSLNNSIIVSAQHFYSHQTTKK